MPGELDAITAELEVVLSLSERYLPGYAHALLTDIHARLKSLPPPVKSDLPPAIPQEFSSPAPPQPEPAQPAPPPPPPVREPAPPQAAPKAKVVSHPAHPKAKGQRGLR